MNVRTVNVKGITYVRAADVAAYIDELGATEATDVRNRLNAAAEAFRFLSAVGAGGVNLISGLIGK